MKRQADSQEAFTKLVQAGGDAAPLHLLLGKSYLDLCQNDEARKELERAVELNACLPFGHLNLGVVYQRLGMFDRAGKEFETEMAVSPREPWGYEYRGILYLDSGDPDRALAMFHKAPAVHELPGKVNRERVISFAEERRYLAEATPSVRDMATLAVGTGLRPNSELFPLLWVNVHLNPSAEGPHGFVHVSEGKTDAARRNVPLTPRARAILEMRKPAKGGSAFVFPGPGNSGHITTVQHAHERTIERVNKAARERRQGKDVIEPFEFYCWRHTCGTRWAEAGLDKYSVARLMGHSSPRVSERYYIHVTEPHVTTGFERFLTYQAQRLVESVPAVTERVQ